jgi:hypothetical protein
MKYVIAFLAVPILVGSMVFAAGTYAIAPYTKKTPPPFEMLDAYPLALHALGTQTNQWHCMAACVFAISISPVDNYGGGGVWFFTFANTNGHSQSIHVFFDRTTEPPVEVGKETTKIPPPLEMIDAYHLALHALGTQANEFHCLSALKVGSSTNHTTVVPRSNDYNSHGGGKWRFDCANTNGTYRVVDVFFDRTTELGKVSRKPNQLMVVDF